MFERAPEHGLWEAITEIGAGSIVYSPLAQGLLTSRYLNGVPVGSRASVGRWMTEANISEVYLERARGLNAIAQQRGQSLAQLAIAWVLRQPAVTSALVGASSVVQLEDSLQALNRLDITDDELARIEPFAVDGTGGD
jgi:L-glyceraldehyde 3-phosphate reductase